MEVFRLEVGPLATNCYLAYDDESKDGIVIDPGAKPDFILAEIEKRGLHIRYVVNTHGHFDHTIADAEIAEACQAPVLIHEADVDYIAKPMDSAVRILRQGKLVTPGGFLKDGDTVTFGSCSLTVLHTPGHTPGGVCLFGHNVLFSGDTLFRQSVGRTDLEGGSWDTLMVSLQKLVDLPPETIVCPGHGGVSTIGDELRGNPYLKAN